MKLGLRATIEKTELRSKLGLTLSAVNYLIRTGVISQINPGARLMPRFYPESVCRSILLNSGDQRLRERAIVWLWSLEPQGDVND